MRSVAILALGAGLCAIAGAQETVRGDSASAVSGPGIHELVLPGTGRRYTISIPDGYTDDEPVPLILSLHYGGEVTPWYGRGLLDTLVGPALADLGAIIVAPDSIARGWADAEAEGYVLELLDHVEAHYNIDSERTLVTGYSMGGMGTWYFAPRHPDRFKAAIPIAGRPGADVDRFDWQTPTYVIHSNADELIPLEPTATVVDTLKARGAPIDLIVVDEITHFEMARFQPHLEAAVPWVRGVWND